MTLITTVRHWKQESSSVLTSNAPCTPWRKDRHVKTLLRIKDSPRCSLHHRIRKALDCWACWGVMTDWRREPSTWHVTIWTQWLQEVYVSRQFTLWVFELRRGVFVKADINSPPESLTYEASPLAVVTTATMWANNTPSPENDLLFNSLLTWRISNWQVLHICRPLCQWGNRDLFPRNRYILIQLTDSLRRATHRNLPSKIEGSKLNRHLHKLLSHLPERLRPRRDRSRPARSLPRSHRTLLQPRSRSTNPDL